ncbi:MAG: cation:proton antiporter [Xylophilus ampelinus]
MEILPPILAMLTLVAFSGLLSRNSVAIPLPLLQVALGAVAAWPTHGLRVSMDLQLFMGLFIPPLLFADGWQMPKREFGAYRSAILGLSIGLVLITIFVLGWVIHWMIPSIPLPLSFLLAAVLSPTDAVAVSGIVRGRAMPPRLQHVLEGESLMNDATALVAMKVALAAALTEHFSMRQALSEFVAMACGGLLVGAGFSWCFMRLYDAFLAHGTQRHGATVPTVLLLFLMPFAPYMIAERLEFRACWQRSLPA